MKKINLIEWLWKTDSHEKQKVRGMQKYCILLLLLFTCVAHAWADNFPSDGVLFLKVNSNWKQSTPRFAVYFFNNSTSSNTWVSMTQVGSTDYYYAAVPSGTWPNCIFCRMNGDGSHNDNQWGNKWNQTADLSASSGKNCFSIGSNSWDGDSDTNWGTYKPSSAASVSASSESITTAETSTLTTSITNTAYNVKGSTSYSVTTNPGGAGSVTSGGVFSATAAGTYTVTATVTYYPKGYSSLTSTDTKTQDITVTAAVSNTLTVRTDGHGSITTPSGGTAVYTIGTPVSIVAADGDGYTFKNWTVESGTATIASSTSKSTTVTVTAGTSATVQANYTEVKSTVTVNANQTSMGSLKFGSTSMSWGTTASVGVTTSQSITATASSGYIFSRWVLSGGAATSSSLTSGNITLKGSGTGADGIAKAVFGKQYYYVCSANWSTFNSTTPHESGLYAYYSVSGAQEFKITAAQNWDTEYTTIDNSLGNVTLSGGSGSNITSSQVGSYYILICYPNTDINESSDPVICASTTLPSFVETTYAVTFNAGANGSVSVRGNDISAGSSQSVQIGTIGRTLTATPASGYHFVRWNTTGSVTIADASSASTTVTATGTGTVTATWIAASGWYLQGGWDGNNQWETSFKGMPVDNPYRGISGVYYRPFSSLANNAFFGIHDGTNKYSGSTSETDNTNYNSLNQVVELVVNNKRSFQAKTSFSNKWVVIKTTDTKKFWIQDPATYYTVTVSNEGSGARGTVVLKEKSYGNLATNEYANGETIRVEIDTVAHYSIKSVKLGDTNVTMTHSSGTKYVGDAVMPASDATLTVTYTPWYKVQLAASPAAAADAPTAAKTTGGASVAHNSYVLDGTSVTFSKDATPNDGYTFDHWDKNGSNVGSGNTYVATISAATTVTAVYTPNKYTITLDNQCAYSDGTHNGGSATEFEVTYGTSYFTYNMTAEPSSYNYDFGGWYTAVGGGGQQIITDLGALTSSATDYTNASGKWNYDGGATLYAKWSKSYTTGLSEGINANGGSGGAITLTYNSSATSGFTPSTRTGYLLAGYYTAATDGDKVINADGTIVGGDVDGYVDDGKWVYCSNTTFKIYAHWTPITYTIAFDKNDDASYLNSDSGTDPDDIAATYAVSYTIPACPYTRTGYSFVGWSTAAHKAKGSVSSTPASDYDYRGNYPASNLSSTQGATVTLYPKWQGNEYTISFNPRGGSVSPTSKEMRYGETYGSNFYDGELPVPYSIPTGKAFIGWFTSPTGGTQVTKDTQLSTVGAHTLYARYSDIATVYFKNTIGWSEVYVTYAAYWDTYADKGTGNNGLTYHKMSLVPGTTDIYKDEIPSAILANWTAGDNSNIAFNSQELLTDKNKYAPTTGDYNNYDKGEVVFRHDFDSRATMFVPRDKNTNDEDGNYKKNSAQYISTGYSGESSDPKYTSGYWMKYGDTYSGYLFSYQKNAEGDFSTECGMNTSVAGDTIFVYTVKMEANTRYDLRIRKDCQTTNTKSRQFRYGTEITSAACTDLKLVCDPSNNSWMQTTAAGEYKFILICKKDGHMYLTVKYPLAVNDYQVLYSWNDSSAKNYASEVIKAHPDTVDTISVFVHKLESPVVSRSMKIQKCTGINGSGVPTWTDVTGGGIDLTDVKATGVYDFEITQPETGDPTGAFAGKYEADYYIRTACSDGGWDQYLEREDNVMTYSAYSMTQTLSAPYSHYYCRYVGSTSTDITFAIATKYSPNISGTKTGDATIGNAATTLPANANVRFSWNEETNAMARAYIKDAQGPSNARFMVMHGKQADMIFNPNGSAISASGSLAANELQFDDMGDWIYQVMLQAKPGAEVSIIANYNNADRYLVGGASSFETIMGGEGSNKYTIMAIYDFKTNRLMNAWTPSGDITDALSDVDMLWIRHRQNSAQQITFNGGSLTNVKAVGAIRLDYNDLVGHVASWTYETRPLLRYFISFPFDVNASDIFGLHGAELGREFVIRKYDGAERAKNGLFLGDGDTYWIDLTMDSVMHANEGYSLVFDNEYLNGDLGSIWENKTGGSSVYLYFPAAKEIASISDANKGTILAEHVCEDTRSFDYKGASVSHANSDSHWNLIGSPLFVDSYVYNSSGTNGQAGDKERTTLDSYYAYNVEFNYWEPELYHKGGAYYACKAMHAMLVQFAGSVTWSKNEPNPSLAPSRERKEETVSNLLITLNLLQNGADGDRTYIKLDEDGNSEFMLCEDLFKIDNKKIPNIFSYASGNAVAYNKVAVESQTINLGVDIRKDGTYTFTMPENVAGQVTLIDTFDATRTNLNIEDYEIYLNKGNYYDRFYLEININKVPTAIDGVTDGSGTLKDGKAHKFIMNDMMYIIRDGVLYDAQGKRVK